MRLGRGSRLLRRAADFAGWAAAGAQAEAQIGRVPVFGRAVFRATTAQPDIVGRLANQVFAVDIGDEELAGACLSRIGQRAKGITARRSLSGAITVVFKRAAG